MKDPIPIIRSRYDLMTHYVLSAGISPGDTIGLNLEGNLYIGGVQRTMMLPSAVGVATGFHGCVTEVCARCRTSDAFCILNLSL